MYVIKGHGERELTNTERAGFSQASDQMDKANYEVKELLLARDPKVPDDAAVVIVPGPEDRSASRRSSPRSTPIIARGGKAFFMATPFQAEGLRKYLEKYGFLLDDDVVIELNPLGQLFGTGPLVPDREPVRVAPDHAGSRRADDALPADRARSRRPRLPRRARWSSRSPRPARSRGARRTSPSSPRARPSPTRARRRARSPVARRGHGRRRRPQRRRARPKAPEPKKPAKARIVVIGTANFASNQFLGAQGNQRLLPERRVLARRGGGPVLGAPEDTKQNPIVFDLGAVEPVLWLPLAILPGAVVLVWNRSSIVAPPPLELALGLVDELEDHRRPAVLVLGSRRLLLLRHLLARARAREGGVRQGPPLDHRAEGRGGPHHQAGKRHDPAQARRGRLGDARAGEGAR